MKELSESLEIVYKAQGMAVDHQPLLLAARRGRVLLLVLALLCCLPSHALTSPSKTRVGGCDRLTPGRFSLAEAQAFENAMGLERYGYESASGRPQWLNRDPIGERGGVNLYLFNHNSPIDNIDPDGQRSLKDWVNILLCAIGVACSDDPVPKIPRNPTAERIEEETKRANERRGNSKRGTKGTSKCFGPLLLLPGLLEDLDRFIRAEENDRSYEDQLRQDLNDFPIVNTPFGPMPNPYYGTARIET